MVVDACAEIFYHLDLAAEIKISGYPGHVFCSYPIEWIHHQSAFY